PSPSGPAALFVDICYRLWCCVPVIFFGRRCFCHRSYCHGFAVVADAASLHHSACVLPYINFLPCSTVATTCNRPPFGTRSPQWLKSSSTTMAGGGSSYTSPGQQC